MFTVEANCAYVLVVALLTLLVAVVIWQRHRTGKTIVVWLASAALGILLGSTGAFAAVRLAGFQLARSPRMVRLPSVVYSSDQQGQSGETEGERRGPPGAGGPRSPRPKRNLTTLVRELELLTGDIAIVLSAQQAASLANALADIETAETMSDEQAQAKHDEILALLDEDQKARLEAVGLPRQFGRGRGGSDQDPEANPFVEETNAEALIRLRDRLAPAEQSDDSSPAQP